MVRREHMFWWGRVRFRDNVEDLDVDLMIILKWNKQIWQHWVHYARVGKVAGCCEMNHHVL
jgi:hypothetical protein